MSGPRRFRLQSWGARFGLAVACVWVFTALFAPWLSPHSPDTIDLTRELARPGPGHLLGTGENGIDVLTHVLHGARVSLEVSFFAVLLSGVLGITLGGIAGYAGGLVDEGLMRLVDVLLAFPGILLALFITSVLGPSLANVVFALSFTGWTGYARLTRGQVLTLRERDYVQAARALGSGPGRILLRHLLPNAAGPLLVQATFALPGAIVAEASLSFLGLGVPPGTPSWGALVDQGTQYLLVAPHVALFPGIALAVTVLGFNLLGDALRDAMDPRHQGP
ncbi:ABC transporter permease [Corallococcus praedator]|uniref:ABC transporter permease n=1 Tax=Corallococcus praedator TaxID=2316724 RepID=A0ABX9QBK7_9BACT|nr:MULTISPECIES: ABC transporter permease [Corallococcus]RKH24117.1 ABC transporter permease [Corallococcus sp. CA031C]RKH99940.1 ABC transporter permease [Corallococcus praedator]